MDLVADLRLVQCPANQLMVGCRIFQMQNAEFLLREFLIQLRGYHDDNIMWGSRMRLENFPSSGNPDNLEAYIGLVADQGLVGRHW